MPTRKIARDASSGRFISLRDAHRRPATTVVETVHVSRNGVRRLKRRRSARHIVEEPQMERDFKAGKDQRTAGANKQRPTSRFKAGKDI
jgi:hypothetical protein